MRLGPGDFFGRPFKLTGFERRWVHRLFEYYPEFVSPDYPLGIFRYKRALFLTGKGNGKTPFEGALGAEALAGPTAPISPLVLVAASALVQSNLVFGDLRQGITHDESPLKPFVRDYDLAIELVDGPGEIRRVAAVTGSNDGPRATKLLADELHEWTGRLGDVFDVLDGAIGKRVNAQTVGISTSGTDKHSLLGRMYDRGVAIATGELTDDETLFECYEIPGENNAAGVPPVEVPDVIRTEADIEQWRRAILWANPALVDGGFLHESYLRSRFDGAQQIERYKWMRYHGNIWTRSEKLWLPAGKWSACQHRRDLVDGEEIVLAFSGTYDRDEAGLIGVARSDGYVFHVGSWEPPPGATPEKAALYEVPHGEVKAAVKQVGERYKVKRFVANPNGWHGEVSDWTDTYGDKVVVSFDWMHQLKRKHAACSQFFTSVVTGDLSHDGHPAIGRHLDSVTPKETAEGTWIERAERDGPAIALAVAAVLGWDQMAALGRKRKSGRAMFAGG